jgi:hypothetical protein
MKTVKKPICGKAVTQLSLGEMKSIFLARKNGGMTFNAIELDPRFGLRQVNGMTAWRTVQKYMRFSGKRSCAGTMLRPLNA